MSIQTVFRFAMIILLASGPGRATASDPACLRSYLTNEKWTPHSLSHEDLKKALALARDSGVAFGWRYVSGFGDNYAGLAALVTRNESTAPSFAQMVHRHWQTVVGSQQEALYFEKVALRHFSQYVEILQTGTWPDSNQILFSYLTAVRAFGLPDELVFDASWISSRYHFVLDWRAFNLLSLERWANTDRVCLAIDRSKADWIIERDFGFGSTALFF